MQSDLPDGDDTVLRPRGVIPPPPVADMENTVLRPRASPVASALDDENTVLRPRPGVMPPLPDGEDTIITLRDLPGALSADLERTTARVVPLLVDSAPDEETILTVRTGRRLAESGVVSRPPAPVTEDSSALEKTIIRGAVVEDLDDTVIRGPRPTAAPPALVEPPPPAPVAPVFVQHYRFRVNNHETAVPLDKPAYVGRKPSTPRVHSGDVPRLVKVASPLQEVSSTHLEVRQRGSSVIVTDLQSTNGTTVAVPGVPPRKLRQGESLVVSPGTLVDIGDGNIIEILPIQRLL